MQVWHQKFSYNSLTTVNAQNCFIYCFIRCFIKEREVIRCGLITGFCSFVLKIAGVFYLNWEFHLQTFIGLPLGNCYLKNHFLYRSKWYKYVLYLQTRFQNVSKFTSISEVRVLILVTYLEAVVLVKIQTNCFTILAKSLSAYLKGIINLQVSYI